VSGNPVYSGVSVDVDHCVFSFAAEKRRCQLALVSSACTGHTENQLTPASLADSLLRMRADDVTATSACRHATDDDYVIDDDHDGGNGKTSLNFLTSENEDENTILTFQVLVA